MVVKIIILFLVLIVNRAFGNSGCVVPHPVQPGIFLQKFGSNYLLTAGKDDLVLQDGTSLFGICSTGYYSPYTAQHEKEIWIDCSNGAISYRNSQETTIQNVNLECSNNDANYYEHFVESCAHTGIVYGFVIKNVTVVLAEICYDLNRLETKFIRYFAGFRSPILEKQNEVFRLSGKDTVNEAKKIILPTGQNIKNLSLGAAQEFEGAINYTMSPLVPNDFIPEYYRALTSNFANVNTIMWWTSLKNGNWKLLNRLISKRGRSHDVDVFTGTSGTIEDFTYMDGAFERNVPLYVWSFIKNINESGIIVIGINSPLFSPTTDSGLIVCKDICDKMDWLSPLKKTRRLTTLGYIFCCEVDEIVGILDGFAAAESGSFTSKPEAMDQRADISAKNASTPLFTIG